MNLEDRGDSRVPNILHSFLEVFHRNLLIPERVEVIEHLLVRLDLDSGLGG